MKRRTRIAFVGLLFFWPLLRTQTTGVLLSAASSSFSWAVDCYYLYLLSGVVFSIVGVCAGHTLRFLISRKRIVLGCAAIASACNIVLASAIELDAVHPLLLSVGTLLFALCIPLLILAWMCTCADLLGEDHHRIALYIAASFVASFLLGFTQYLPYPIPFLLPIACPLISALCWYAVTREQQDVESTAKTDLRTTFRQLPAKSITLLIITMFLSCFLIGVVRSGSIAPASDTVLFIAKDIATIIVTAIIAVMLHALIVTRRSLRIIWIFIFSVLCLGQLIVLSFHDSPLALLGIGASSAARASLSFFLFFYLLTLIHEKHLPVIPITAGIFLSTNVVSDALSFAVVPALSNAIGVDYSQLIRPVSLAVSVIVFLCLAFFAGSLALSYPSSSDRLSDAEVDLETRIRNLTELYGISQRECEVMELIVQGFSYKATAERLHISEGTVQSHIKRWYTKLDVHSRQELIDIVRE